MLTELVYTYDFRRRAAALAEATISRLVERPIELA
jgi:hypothetical protein